MARYIGRDITPVFAAAEHWKTRCLLDDGSVFSDGRIWTINHLDELDTYFIQGFLTGEKHFLVKFQQQLEKAEFRCEATRSGNVVGPSFSSLEYKCYYEA